MNAQARAFLRQAETCVEALLLGKPCNPLTPSSDNAEFTILFSHLNRLSVCLTEMNRLAAALSIGKLDTPPPRENYMAGPLKQLHSQLSVLSCSMHQLTKGNMAAKMPETGELFSSFNDLLDRMARFDQKSSDSKAPPPSLCNSWRYHQLLQVLNRLHVMVMEIDTQGTVVYANQPAQKALGDLKNISELSPAAPLSEAIIAFSHAKSGFPLHREINSKEQWFSLTTDRLLFPDHRVLYLHIIEDITARKADEHRLVACATLDDMTGAYNRKEGLDRLRSLLEETGCTKEHCIAFLDLNRLKYINDTFGHHQGDYAIQSAAHAMLRSVRVSDVVCRYGGDEFLLIFPHCSETLARELIMQMYSILQQMEQQNPKPYTISFSYGIVPFSSHTVKTASELLSLADQKMYANKLENRYI